MNEKLFKPLQEQIFVVNIKNQPISKTEFNEAANNLIFKGKLDNILEDLELNDEVLDEGALWGKLRWKAWREKLNKLTYKYSNVSDPVEKQKILEKVKKIQKKLATHGYDHRVKYVDEADAEDQEAASQERK